MNDEQLIELYNYLYRSPDSPDYFISNIDRAIQIVNNLSGDDANRIVYQIIMVFEKYFDPYSEYIQDMFRKILHRMKLIGFPIEDFSHFYYENFRKTPLFNVYMSELPLNIYDEEKRYTSQYVGHPSYIIGQYTGSVIPDISHLRLNKNNPKYEEVIDYITAKRNEPPPLSSDSDSSSNLRDTRRSPVRNFGKLRVRSLSPRRNRKIDRNKKTRGRSPVKNLNKRRHRSRSPSR